jgi:hypothetical protein
MEQKWRFSVGDFFWHWRSDMQFGTGFVHARTWQFSKAWQLHIGVTVHAVEAR